MKKAIKHIVLILLTGLYCLTFLKTLSPYMDYALNQEFIAEVLCVTKEKPELQCNGKCYLKEQLKQEASKEQQDQNSSRTTDKENLFTSTAYTYASIVNLDKLSTSFIFPEPSFYFQDITIAIPKPPPEA